jgi:cell division protein FtsQ
MTRFLKILFIIPVLYLLVVPFYYSHLAYTRPCSAVQITISDSNDLHFVTKRDIQNTITGNSGKLIGKPAGEINPVIIEAGMMSRYRELKKAEAYMSIDGTLHIYADQRNPVMRVMAANGGDYYIDSDGFVVRRRNLYSPRLHIVGGNINISQAMLDGVSVLDTSIKNSILKDIYYLVTYINNDSFLSAQIDQVFVDNYDEIDLIPRVGNHVVHLGTAENYREKLKNLEAFYDKVLPVAGWNTYSIIDLAFKGQVVCRRR